MKEAICESRRPSTTWSDLARGSLVANMVQTRATPESPTPLDILKGLKEAARVMIQDPMGREWEILEAKEGNITIRRTQTFNCILQEGLLKSLIRRAGVEVPQAEHIACVRKGAEFCDYEVTWMS